MVYERSLRREVRTGDRKNGKMRERDYLAPPYSRERAWVRGYSAGWNKYSSGYTIFSWYNVVMHCLS